MLDQKLNETGISTYQLNGYERIVGSHLEVARFVVISQSYYVGIGVRSVARLLELEVFPFQEALHDLAVPTAHLTDRPSMATFMDSIVGCRFLMEIGALGGYDTNEPGRSDNYGLDEINCLLRNRTIVALRSCQTTLPASMGDVREPVVPVVGRPRY